MKNLKENNKLIAEFMDWKTAHEDYTEFTMPNDMIDLLKYHKSWSWLMPVVEKIEGTNIDGHYYDVRIQTFETLIVDDMFNTCFEVDSPKNEKIGRTYEVVIQFINWYNENK